MINFNANFGNLDNYYYIRQRKDTDYSEHTSCNAKGREVATSWKYDEEGNIVYYTYDKKNRRNSFKNKI